MPPARAKARDSTANPNKSTRTPLSRITRQTEIPQPFRDQSTQRTPQQASRGPVAPTNNRPVPRKQQANPKGTTAPTPSRLRPDDLQQAKSRADKGRRQDHLPPSQKQTLPQTRRTTQKGPTRQIQSSRQVVGRNGQRGAQSTRHSTNPQTQTPTRPNVRTRQQPQTPPANVRNTRNTRTEPVFDKNADLNRARQIIASYGEQRPLVEPEPDVDVGLKIPRVHKAEYQKRDMASIMGVPDGRVRKVKAEIRDVLRYRYRFVFTKAFTKYPLRTQRRLIETISEEFSSFGWEYWKVKEILFSMAEDAFRNLQNERRAEARIVARLRGSLPEKQPHARQNTHILQPRGQQNSTVSTVQTTYERSTHGNRQTISRQNNARNPPARPATSQPQPVSGRLSGRSLAAGQLNTRSNLDVAMGCGKATESHLGHDNLSDDEFHDEDGTEEDENMDGVDDPDLEEDENTDGVNDPNLEYNEEDVFYGDEVDVVAEAEESGEEDVGIGQSHDEYESGEEDQVGLDQGYSANEDDVMQGRQDEVVDYSTDEMGFEADEDGEYGSHEDDVLDAEYADDQSFNIMASAPNPDEDGNGLHGDYSGDELQEDLAYEKHPNAGDGYTVNDEGSQYGSDDSDERGDVARISPMRIPWKKSASARTSPVQPNKSFFPGAQVHRRLRTSPLREVPKKRARFADDVVDNEPEVERFKAYQSSRMKMDIPPKITADAPHLQPLADSLNRYRENMIRRAEAREKMWTTFRGSDGRQEQADAPLNTATYSSQNLPKPRPPSTAADKQAARAGFKFPDSIETLPTSWDPPPEITRKGRVVTTTESMRQYKQEQERARRRTMRRKVWKAHVGDRKEQNSAVAAEIRNRVRGGGVPVPSSSKWNGREMNQ